MTPAFFHHLRVLTRWSHMAAARARWRRAGELPEYALESTIVTPELHTALAEIGFTERRRAPGT